MNDVCDDDDDDDEQSRTTGISVARTTQTCFAPPEAMMNANRFKRLRTLSYSNSLGGQVATAVPSMNEFTTDGTFSKFLNKNGERVEVNYSGAQSKTDKGTAAPLIHNMNAINIMEMDKTINTVAGKANDDSVGGKFPMSNRSVYGSLFSTPIFNSHQSAIIGMHSEKAGLSLGKKGLSVRAYSTDKPNTPSSLRPLSPHLPVYKPQLNSMVSIFNRFAAAFLTAEILVVYLLLEIGSTSFTYYNFYQLFFYSSKLTLLGVELTALAVAFHLVYGIGALVRPFRR
ncbi:succinate dehydrogenase 3-2 [Euphorbia peplus]|nr:succinate dehydrogenase 3-2 [Euphorbia peplus]